MTRLALAVLGALAVSLPAWAQAPAPADAIEKALLAAPANMKNDATIVAFKPDYTYETIKKGTNTMVCFDRSGLPGQQPFSVECTSLGNLPRVAQNLKFEAETDRTKRQAALDAAEKDGSRVKPEYGSVWYRLQGKDKDTARMHMTVAVPGATTQSTGLADNPKQGGVWIMNAGTSTAHLMIPGH
jgi:hypothetical protein